MQALDLTLTGSELHRLTLYRSGAKQAKVLREWGIRFVMGRDGHPRVLREHLKIVTESSAQTDMGGVART